MPNPIYKKEDGWYWTFRDLEKGPYETSELAWSAFRVYAKAMVEKNNQ